MNGLLQPPPRSALEDRVIKEVREDLRKTLKELRKTVDQYLERLDAEGEDDDGR
jgi:hypothetical protein